jgi:signal transduction histidine kinase
MNGIIGLSSLLEDSELSPMQAETMKMIVSSGELLVAIVNDVLDYSKLESGKVDISIQRSNLKDALSGTVHSINLRGKSRNVSVHTNYDPLIPEYIETDARRLKQILYNLLGKSLNC